MKTKRHTITALAAAGLLALTAGSAVAGSPIPAAKQGHYASNLQHTGGTGTDFALQQIRWGDHHDFERIVLEFSPPDPARDGDLPRMRVETEFYPVRMAVRLPGSRYGSGNISPSGDLFRKSRLMSSMDVFDVCGGGPHLVFNAARPVEFEVFTLPAPPRLVVDVIPSRMPPMREERKYSLRTLTLYGDQVCLFLDESADAGVTPRLISDADGNIFGEVSLFDEADEAFRAAERYNGTLGRQFSLKVRARGMMETPKVLP